MNAFRHLLAPQSPLAALGFVRFGVVISLSCQEKAGPVDVLTVRRLVLVDDARRTLVELQGDERGGRIATFPKDGRLASALYSYLVSEDRSAGLLGVTDNVEETAVAVGSGGSPESPQRSRAAESSRRSRALRRSLALLPWREREVRPARPRSHPSSGAPP